MTYRISLVLLLAIIGMIGVYTTDLQEQCDSLEKRVQSLEQRLDKIIPLPSCPVLNGKIEVQ